MEKGPAGRTRTPSRRKHWAGGVVLFLPAGIPGCGGPSLLALLGAGEGDVSPAGGPEPEPPWRSCLLAPRCLGLSPCPGLRGSSLGLAAAASGKWGVRGKTELVLAPLALIST